MRLVECVPNFSEGRDMSVIDAITNEIKSVKDVQLLDVDPGADTNRTVVTFVGTPEMVGEAAFKAVKKASELIDMSKHKGAHARMGATDVCPFIPVSGVTMQECVQISKRVGERVAKELNIPVYFYEFSANCEERKNLANIRQGEYECLPEKLKDPKWKPDCGDACFNSKAGVTVMGARQFLIAYNINLNTKDKKLAHEIALNIREAGRSKKDAEGNIIRDDNGKAIKVPGIFKGLKAVGWYIDEYKQAQVSMNITDHHETPVHIIFDEVCNQAEKLGLRVTGSELVGLIPKDAMIDAGVHYLSKQGKSTGIPEEDIILTAIQSLGLEDISEFDPKKKVIEYRLTEDAKKDRQFLRYMTLRGFANELSTDSPAPGGGSVAALSASMGSALSSMVANLTIGKKGYEKVTEKMKEIAVSGQKLKDEFLLLIDEDTDAFSEVMAAMKLPKKSDEDKKIRQKAIEDANKYAAEIPLKVLEKTTEIFPLAKEVAQSGNQNSLSDSGVAAICAQAAARSAYYNVIINLQSIEDKKFVEETRKKADQLLDKAYGMYKEVRGIVDKALGLEQAVGAK
ncbi:MAG: glutamate formimidoyltransferase [Armatimonadota bacterium]